MTEAFNEGSIEHYKFHHIDTSKCRDCEGHWCVDACFRFIYEISDDNDGSKCVVIEDKEDRCVKCHICTTKCKYEAITID